MNNELITKLSSNPNGDMHEMHISSNSSTLPFDKLHWEDFERFCFQFGSKYMNCLDTSYIYGRNGQQQEGIDIYFNIDGIVDVWQVKRYKKFTCTDVGQAVEKFLEGKWADKSNRFTLCVSTCLNDVNIVDKIHEYTDLLRKSEITFSVLDSEKLTIKTKDYPSIIDAFFGERWRLALLPNNIYVKDNNDLTQSSQIFAPITTEMKVKYQRPSYYIDRKVAPFETIQSAMELYFAKVELKSLLEVCLDKKRIILLSEAGSGKSIELKQLASQVSETENVPFCPVLINLNTYTSEKITELIPAEYSNIGIKQLFLIFDGFDEIEPANLYSFARRINAFSIKHPETPMIISARSNFYKFSDSNQSGTFSKFEEYGLCPLNTDDLKRYCVDQQIDFQAFYEQIYLKNLRELTFSPFYLTELVRLYKVSPNNLPHKSDLMKQIIKSRFDNDGAKYNTTKDLSSFEYDLGQLLEKLAFSLQCMQKTHISNEEYQQLFISSERGWLNYSGIWSMNAENKWSFEHNIFREYLAAKYLSLLPIEKIKEIISYEDEIIKDSWLNVLAFLVLIYEKDELLEWMQKTNPAMMFKFEASRVSKELRTKIFIDILEEHKQRNLWLSRWSGDLHELALFGQSCTTLEYLLQEIQNPVNFHAQYNAIYVLREFTDLFSFEDKVKQVLLSCCEDKSTREHEKGKIIIALSALHLNDSDTTSKLFELFANSESSDIRYGLYHYLVQSKLQNEYVEYFLDGILFQQRQSDRDVSCSYVVMKGLMQIDKYEAVKSALAFFAEGREHVYFYDSEKIVDYLITTAKELFLSGNIEIFDDVCQLLHAHFKQYKRNSIKAIKVFFQDTNTKQKAFKKILSFEIKYSHVLIDLLESVLGEQYREWLYSEYKNKTLPNRQLFIDLVYIMNPDELNYSRYCRKIFDMDGIIIKATPRIDYEQIRIKGQQDYFDALFDINKFSHLIDELISILGNEQITYEELKDDYRNLDRLDKKEGLQQVVWAINECKFKDPLVKNFSQYVFWEGFSMACIYNVLRHNPKNLHINDSQREYIRGHCLKIVEKTDFNTAVTYKSDGEFTYTWEVCYFMFFSSYFDFDYEKDTFLDMLMMPTYFMANNEDYTCGFPTYITNHLSMPDILERVQFNLQNKNLVGEIAITHLKCCNENNLLYGIELAIKICNTAESSEWHKSNALDYLIKIKGEEYVINTFLPSSDDDLLRMIADKLSQFASCKLENCLIEKNEKSEDGKMYLSNLIAMNSVYGLEKYYELSKTINSVPDYNGDDGNIGSLTETISAIRAEALLPRVIKLVHLLFSPGFKDRSMLGLYNSLHKAMENISLENYPSVYNELQIIIKNSAENQAKNAFCNNLLEAIRKQNNKQRDIPWGIQDLKQFWG